MILAVLLLAASALFLTTPVEYLNDAALLTVPFPLLAGLLCLRGRGETVRALRSAFAHRSAWLPALGLSALYLLLLSLDELFKCGLFAPTFALLPEHRDAGTLFRLRLYAARFGWPVAFGAGLYLCMLLFCEGAPRFDLSAKTPISALCACAESGWFCCPSASAWPVIPRCCITTA